MMAVVVGLLINLTSAYLKNPLDIFLTRISKAWKSNKEKRQALIENLSKDDSALILYALSEGRYRTRSIVFLLLSAATFTLAIALIKQDLFFARVFAIIAVMTAFLGMFDHSAAARISSVTKETIKIKKGIDT